MVPLGGGMTTLCTKLDMYGSAASAPVFAALGDYVIAGLGAGLGPSTLMLGQICGIEFAHAAPGQYHYLGSFSLPGFARGTYNSVLISHIGGALDHIEAFDPVQHVIAINEAGSFSGAIAPAAHLLSRGDAIFPHRYMTGGHLNSITAVAAGKADLAAIDRLSFNLAKATSLDGIEQVRVIDVTPARPGLPFICDAAVEDVEAEIMRQRLARAMTQPFWGEFERLLEVTGIDMINPADFAAMREV